MANLVFTGHETRGKELHKLLENLGGVDAGYIDCNCITCYYYINREGLIECSNSIPSYMNNRVIMSLEEFERRYLYKVGDKVQHKDATSCGSVFEIEKMRWVNNDVEYIVKRLWYNNCRTTFTAKDLQPYKEETMEKEISGAIVDRFICLEGYVFYDDKGNIIDTKEITMKKKKPKYPKTFVECAKILDCFCSAYIGGYKCELLENLQELLICRDAYWKIAGDWKPNFNDNEGKYVIAYCYGKVYTTMTTNYNRILVFPTEEMRDAFYENFKELIEECKELL